MARGSGRPDEKVAVGAGKPGNAAAEPTERAGPEVDAGGGAIRFGFGVASGNGDESRVHTGGGVPGASTLPSPDDCDGCDDDDAGDDGNGIELGSSPPGRVASSFSIESRSKSLLPLTALGLSTERGGSSSGMSLTIPMEAASVPTNSEAAAGGGWGSVAVDVGSSRSQRSGSSPRMSRK